MKKHTPLQIKKIKESWVCPVSKFDSLNPPKFEDVSWLIVVFYNDGSHEKSYNVPTKSATQAAYQKLI